MTKHQHDGKSLELNQVLILFLDEVYRIEYSYFQIDSSNSMPPPGGIRSYQTVNDGTDDQFVCEQIFQLEVININLC